jgi:photosystem II stability/assembly factor-like uncharacterized protein
VHNLDTITAENLYGITFVSKDTGFICGGSRFTNGVILYTTDGGSTWKAHDSVSLYVLNAVKSVGNSVISVGHTGKVAFSIGVKDSFAIGQMSGWEELYGIDVKDTVGIMVGGNSYGDGVIYRKRTDGSGEWDRKSVRQLLTDISIIDDTLVFVCGYGAIYRSVDAGRTWNLLNATGDFFKSIRFYNTLIGYAVGYAGTILKTEDGGYSWSRLRNGNSLLNANWHFNTLCVLSASHLFVAGDHGILLETTDGGKHWKKAVPFTDLNINKLWLSADGKRLWMVSDQGGIHYLDL